MVSTDSDESDNVDIEYHNNVNEQAVIKSNSFEEDQVTKVTPDTATNCQDHQEQPGEAEEQQEPTETDYTSSDSDSWVAECYYKTVTLTSDNCKDIGDHHPRPETSDISDPEDTRHIRHCSCSPSLCQTDQVCCVTFTSVNSVMNVMCVSVVMSSVSH